MDSTFGGAGIKCPYCKKQLAIKINHTMEEKHLDEIIESLEVLKDE